MPVSDGGWLKLLIKRLINILPPDKIKINLDRSQEPIKLLVINAKKELYVAPARNSEAILARIEPPADADEETIKKVVFPSAVTEFGKELRKFAGKSLPDSFDSINLLPLFQFSTRT